MSGMKMPQSRLTQVDVLPQTLREVVVFRLSGTRWRTQAHCAIEIGLQLSSNFTREYHGEQNEIHNSGAAASKRSLNISWGYLEIYV